MANQSTESPVQNQFLGHEVLHTSYLYSNHWEQDIVEHPFTQANEKLKELAEKIAELMAEFYQEVGQLS